MGSGTSSSRMLELPFDENDGFVSVYVQIWLTAWGPDMGQGRDIILLFSPYTSTGRLVFDENWIYIHLEF